MNKEKEIKELMEVGAHFAYSKSRRHPSAKPFIFGVKNNVEIFDLEKTSEHLKVASDFISKIVAEGGQILFVGNKKEAMDSVQRGAEEAEMPYVANRWIGGTLTNLPEIKKRVGRLEDLLSQKEKGELSRYTKKERLLIDREIEKLEKMFSGIVSMKKLPMALFVIDPRKEKTAVSEARRKHIPIVALAGSDCDFNSVDFPIPANDASISSINYFIKNIVETIKKGQKEEQKEKKELLT